jgi:hypothetical protein
MQIPYGLLIALVIFACVYANRVAPPNTRTLLMALVTLPTVAGFASAPLPLSPSLPIS